MLILESFRYCTTSHWTSCVSLFPFMYKSNLCVWELRKVSAWRWAQSWLVSRSERYRKQVLFTLLSVFHTHTHTHTHRQRSDPGSSGGLEISAVASIPHIPDFWLYLTLKTSWLQPEKSSHNNKTWKLY